MTDILFNDFETRSQCDLPFFGLTRYAQDPTTEPICWAYAIEDAPTQLWWYGDPFPREVIKHVENGGLMVAHNAAFDRHIWNEVLVRLVKGVPPTDLTQWQCSMVQSLTSGYPAGLDAAATLAGLAYQKNPAGTRLIREYCAPNFLTEWKEGDRELMGTYCISDVDTMRDLTKVTRPLTEEEWAEYHLTEKTNDIGLPVDVEFCTAVLGYSNEIRDDAAEAISKITEGAMTKPTQRKARDAFVLPKLTAEQRKAIEVYKKGVKKVSFDADHRAYLQAFDDLDHEVRELLEWIDNAGSAALKKFGVAANQHVDGRVHQCFLFNGAGQTGRFSGKGLQPHNMRRDAYGENEAEALIQDIIEDYEVDAPATTMARLSRSMITSEAGIYFVDWSAIEGRVAPWLANCPSGEEKLDLYREDKDVYVTTAALMFERAEHAIDDNLRQTGKVCELSLQFGGGYGALASMAKNYGMVIEEDQGKGFVKLWRKANPWAEATWYRYDTAIENAVRAPGETFNVGRVSYQSDGANYLWCCLPCGRILSYPKPRMEMYTTPWGEERYGPTFQLHIKAAAGDPPIRRHARGALLFQNSVQATAASLLRRALIECDKEELGIIGHCHDEVVGEGPREDGELLNEIMLESPDWLGDMPLATGGVKWSKRYGKA